MHQLDTAAAFIRSNMPLGRGGSLDAQQAWDVAMFIDGHERPQDPRFTGDVDFDAAEPIVSAITPVPGGVGSVTTAVLALHVAQAAENNT